MAIPLRGEAGDHVGHLQVDAGLGSVRECRLELVPEPMGQRNLGARDGPGTEIPLDRAMATGAPLAWKWLGSEEIHPDQVVLVVPGRADQLLQLKERLESHLVATIEEKLHDRLVPLGVHDLGIHHEVDVDRADVHEGPEAVDVQDPAPEHEARLPEPLQDQRGRPAAD